MNVLPPAFVLCALTLSHSLFAEPGVTRATFDLPAIRDPRTLEITVRQDWQPVKKVKGIKQKLIEITICEWWSGQKVRIPVTLCAPDSAAPCTNLIVSNMGLNPQPALPSGAVLKLLTEHEVGVVLVGVGPLDEMEPKGRLHVGMKEHLLKTKDARFTAAWIWGMSDMRALTAAYADEAVFRPGKALATGGSKRGVAAAICGIHDDRFTAILPVVTPIIGNPGGVFVAGSGLHAEAALNAKFREQLPPGPNPLGLPDTTRQALLEREQHRMVQSISREEALAAGWSEAEILQMNDEAWRVCRIASHLAAVRKRGLEFFYLVGTNDSASPHLDELGAKHPDFPIHILPGGQHGGPKTSGFTLQIPSRPETQENLFYLARHHFFGDGALPKAPTLAFDFDATTRKLNITIRGLGPAAKAPGQLSWCVNPHLPYTYALEHDQWQSVALPAAKDGSVSLAIEVPGAARTVALVSTHCLADNGMNFHYSSPYRVWARR